MHCLSRLTVASTTLALPCCFTQALNERRLALRVDSRGTILGVTDTPASLFGFPPESLLGRSLALVLDLLRHTEGTSCFGAVSAVQVVCELQYSGWAWCRLRERSVYTCEVHLAQGSLSADYASTYCLLECTPSLTNSLTHSIIYSPMLTSRWGR